jgi:hypothetical protein
VAGSMGDASVFRYLGNIGHAANLSKGGTRSIGPDKSRASLLYERLLIISPMTDLLGTGHFLMLRF